MNIDGIFNDLREKLDVLGYTQPLPLSALSLVSSLFEDLIKTTESLRDAKKNISELLEEKNCWELGVEPYKCDNSRLLTECNKLNTSLIDQKEEFESILLSYAKKIRNLETDKKLLTEHCEELESQVRDLAQKYADPNSLKNKKYGVDMIKKPAFVTTVRSGKYLANSKENCFDGRCKRIAKEQNFRKNEDNDYTSRYESEKIKDSLKDCFDELTLCKKKVETRDREIRRLIDLLHGGRPATALARDCCYRQIGSMTEDLEILQQEKLEAQTKIFEYENEMHEAKKRALDLIAQNKRLESELEELKQAALSFEKEVNLDVNERERNIQKLQERINKLTNDKQQGNCSKNSNKMPYTEELGHCNSNEKKKMNERLNEMTAREREMAYEIEKLNKKNEKMKFKLIALQNEIEKPAKNGNEEERRRLKTERDFFQKEYLNMVHRAGSAKENDYMKMQLEQKENDLTNLKREFFEFRQRRVTPYQCQQCNDNTAFSRNNLYQRANMHSKPNTPDSTSFNFYPNSLNAVLTRSEREKDLIKSELEKIKIERDSLKDRLCNVTETHCSESKRMTIEIEELKTKICNLEREKRELESAQIPGQTHIVLMKEEIVELKKRLHDLHNENCKLSTSNKQTKLLHDQTEKALSEMQNKYTIALNQLENSEQRTLGTNRSQSELETLKNEILSLKSLNNTLENEKDKIIMELDSKTEKLYDLESENKSILRKLKDIEGISKEYQDKYKKLLTERKSRDNELDEADYQSKSLKTQVTTLKASMENTVAENSRLSAELADTRAEILVTKSKLKDSEKEVERLRKQLQQYVSEVKKAEELLMTKEKEREEMLDHYRHLSHDAVILEGNNQSLEIETAEQRRLLSEAEAEVESLKKELCHKNEITERLERQVSSLSAQVVSLERELELSYDNQHLLKIDLDAMKELCEKLDLQRDKLNAELEELGAIRNKLERENEKLRRLGVLPGNDISNQAAADSLESLLNRTRDELDNTRRNQVKLSIEVKKLKEKNDELEVKLRDEKKKFSENKALTEKYSLEVDVLQHNITDDRFKAAQNREDGSSTL